MSAAAAVLVGGGITTAVLLSGDDEPQAAPPIAVTTSSESAVVTTVSTPSSEPATSSPVTAKPTSAKTTTTSAKRTETSAPVDDVTMLNRTADQFIAAVMAANKPALMTLVCDPGRIGEPRKPPPGDGVKRSGSAKVNGTTGTVLLTVTAEGKTVTESFNARKQNGKWCMTMR